MTPLASHLTRFAFAFAIFNCSYLQAQDSLLRVMSFNIRYGTANDGPNHWNKRKELVAKTIRNFNPDVLGTQETLDFQAKFLKEGLPNYDYVGRSRQAKPGEGEQCGIFYKRDRFDQLAAGHFWLSETPDQPGSKSWDSSLPRMATWVKLWDRQNKRSFFFLNTHFDHRGKLARQNSAQLIRNSLTSFDSPHIILAGDFNTAVHSRPYQSLFKLSKKSINLMDSFHAVEQRDSPKISGTFNGFKGTQTGARIDWIGVSEQGFGVVSASIERAIFDDRYPSDHFPVTSVLRFEAPERNRFGSDE